MEIIRITRIEYFINEEHYESDLPPVKIEDCDIIGSDLQKLRKIVDEHKNNFSIRYNISKPIAVMKIEKIDDTEVHRIHCCKKHGCKYGETECLVTNNKIEQQYPCKEY